MGDPVPARHRHVVAVGIGGPGHQLGLRLQHVGHAEGWTQVELDGTPDSFGARYLDADGRLVAALVANRPREAARLRRELAAA